MIPLFNIDNLAEDSCREFEKDGRQCFAVKKDGQIYLYENRCPHLGIELNWQENQFLDPDHVLIQCSTHGALFQVEDGQCVSGPCIGDKLLAIDFEVRDGDVYLSDQK